LRTSRPGRPVAQFPRLGAEQAARTSCGAKPNAGTIPAQFHSSVTSGTAWLRLTKNAPQGLFFHPSEIPRSGSHFKTAVSTSAPSMFHIASVDSRDPPIQIPFDCITKPPRLSTAETLHHQKVSVAGVSLAAPSFFHNNNPYQRFAKTALSVTKFPAAAQKFDLITGLCNRDTPKAWAVHSTTAGAKSRPSSVRLSRSASSTSAHLADQAKRPSTAVPASSRSSNPNSARPRPSSARLIDGATLMAARARPSHNTATKASAVQCPKSPLTRASRDITSAKIAEPRLFGARAISELSK